MLNGRVTPEVVLIGLGITALMGAGAWVLFDYTPRREWRLVRKIPLFLCYLGVLWWQIMCSAAGIVRIILNTRRAVEPSLVTFTADLRTDAGRFLLATSITLTPGTITVSVEGNRFTVHCLRSDMLDTSPDGLFLRWIRRLEA